MYCAYSCRDLYISRANDQLITFHNARNDWHAIEFYRRMLHAGKESRINRRHGTEAIFISFTKYESSIASKASVNVSIVSMSAYVSVAPFFEGKGFEGNDSPEGM